MFQEWLAEDVYVRVYVLRKANSIMDLPHWHAENKLKPMFYHDRLIHLTCSLSKDASFSLGWEYSILIHTFTVW